MQPEDATLRLPRPRTPLVGRSREVRALQGMLTDRAVQLVTLTGPGGVGKTRVALAAAEATAPAFAGAVRFVDLAPLRDPARVPSAIVRALGLSEAAGGAPLAQLAAFLGNQRFLLLLDNFEQVLTAASPLAELLSACAGLTLLVTSRAPLRLRGEHEVRIEPLSLPNPTDQSTPERLAASPSVALFTQRVEEIRADFALTPENAAAVADLCRRLDGLPLALELAAARMRLFTPRALLDRLGFRLPVLTDGPRDAPARQQTLRDTIAWSHDLLTLQERVLFGRLAVCSGGWTLEAATALSANEADGAGWVLDALTGLVQHSLVFTHETPAGETRFGMLETIREFALEQLAASGEGNAVHDRHVAYFTTFAQAAAPRLVRSGWRPWMQRLTDERENLYAALRWTVAQNDAEAGLQLISSLHNWFFAEALSDGYHWAAAVLALPSAAAPSSRRARALHSGGRIASLYGDSSTARRWLEESVAFLRELDESSLLPHALTFLKITISADPAAALSFGEEATALFRRAGDQHGVALSLTSSGRILVGTGDAALAHAYFTEAAALYQAAGHWPSRGVPLMGLGELALWQGDYPRARAWLEESLAAFRTGGPRLYIVTALERLGWAAYYERDATRAREQFQEALSTAQAEGFGLGMVVALQGFAAVSMLRGAPTSAARLLGAAHTLKGDREQTVFAQPWLASRFTADVRAALGDEAFAVAWEAGRTLSLEQALAEAEAAAMPPPARPRPGAADLPDGLTAREAEVLGLLAAGQSNQEIATTLVLSPKTVERHLANIYAKIRVRGRVEASTYAQRHNLVSLVEGGP